MMLTLAIEVSNPSSGPDSCQVALGTIGNEGATAIDVEPVEPGSRHRDDLIPACHRLLTRCGRGPGDIECIAVDVGPGGFTGLRIAVAASASMALALGAKLVAVPASRVAATAARERAGSFAVVLATKRERGWVQVFSDSGEESGREIGTSEFSELAASGETIRIIADGHLPESWRSIADDRNWPIEPLALTATGLLVAAAACPTEVDPGSLRPIYAREPEAVTLWRARHGSQ